MTLLLPLLACTSAEDADDDDEGGSVFGADTGGDGETGEPSEAVQ
jgi:hypothetical protein